MFYANSRQGEAARDSDTREAAKMNSQVKSMMPSMCGGSSDFAAGAEHPGLVSKGGYGNSAAGGCNIDTQSDLIWGAPGTARSKGPKQVFARPFATTPFLGLGNLDGIEDQNKVVFGHSTANRKSIQTVTDKQFPVFQPLLAEKESDIAENNYFVEPFLRGGQASRLIPRQRVDLTK